MIGKWSRGAKVLALTSIGVTLVSLDISIVNVAFGAIAKDFPESRRTLTWVFSAYNIANGLYGSRSDEHQCRWRECTEQ